MFPEGISQTRCDFCGSSLLHSSRSVSGKVEVVDVHDDHVASEDEFEDSVAGDGDVAAPAEPYDPVKESMKDRRARLQRQLDFYNSKSNIRYLRPKDYWVTKLTREIEDLDGQIAGYITPMQPVRRHFRKRQG